MTVVFVADYLQRLKVCLNSVLEEGAVISGIHFYYMYFFNIHVFFIL